MNWIGLLIVAIGLFTVCGALFDWVFYMNNYKARFFVTVLGRTGARVFYGLLGIGPVVVGVMATAGFIES